MPDTICIERDWPIISKKIQPDHIHPFVSIPPAIVVADAVKVLKGVTARWLFQRLSPLKKRPWAGNPWSPSYYGSGAGRVSAETMRRYIERSRRVAKSR